jgi:hypothetical protein
MTISQIALTKGTRDGALTPETFSEFEQALDKP